jgi:hypothetical protein
MTYLNNMQAARQGQPQPPGQVEGPGTAAMEGANEGMDMILWASAQGRALAKLQIYSTMAKQVNDQQ